jgi:hypothetical protein
MTKHQQEKAGEGRIEGTINGEPYSLPAGNEIVPEGFQSRANALSALVESLDRNPNGRHEGDSDAGDPIGVSQGNPYLPQGTRIGTHISGKAIVVPHWRDLTDPEAWLQDPDRSQLTDSGEAGEERDRG